MAAESEPSAAPPNPRVTWEGCSVLLDINDGDRLVFARLSPAATMKIGNSKCSLKPLVGCPFGSLFRVESGGPKGPFLALCPPTSSLNAGDGDVTSMQEKDEWQSKDEAKDNRSLLDNNTAQGLSSEDIDALRRDGATGDAIVDALIANSSTFGKKTVFSQEKYKLKKQKKYAPKVLLRRPFARSICEAYFKKYPTRIGSLRMDSLSLLLSMANVSAYSDVLVVDRVGGLLTGAVAERLGGTGYVCSAYCGSTPYTLDIVRIFNFSSEVCSSIQQQHQKPPSQSFGVGRLNHFLPFSSVEIRACNMPLLLELNSIAHIHDDGALRSGWLKNEEPISHTNSNIICYGHRYLENFEESKQHRIVQAPLSDLCPTQKEVNSCPELDKNDQSSDVQFDNNIPSIESSQLPEGDSQKENSSCKEPAGTLKGSFPRNDVAGHMSINPCSTSVDGIQENTAFMVRKSVIAGRQASPEAIKSWKEKGFSSLIVAAPEMELDSIIHDLLPVLSYSAPFAIYHQYLQPLSTCMHKLQASSMAISLQISEPWLREYQVLPSRTHPHMQMSAFGGYILSGTRISSTESCNGNT